MKLPRSLHLSNHYAMICPRDSEGNFYGEQILSDSLSPTEGDAKVICYDFRERRKEARDLGRENLWPIFSVLWRNVKGYVLFIESSCATQNENNHRIS
ncbi:hypothetical protein CDAR_105161 [Caerostris darwini]|uniref:Uncharacterized protein n=1 Tax=Caerostris darwini TaxID=1538125 RepID=A0AAV4V5M5_9ARAC|nr:hypothetical protein CDAR_105161 [Caerostris darwini]